MPEKAFGEIVVKSVAMAIAMWLINRYGNIVVFGKSKEEKKRLEKVAILAEIETFASKDVIGFIDEIYTERLGKELKKINSALSSEKITIQEYDLRLASLLETHYNKR